MLALNIPYDREQGSAQYSSSVRSSVGSPVRRVLNGTNGTGLETTPPNYEPYESRVPGSLDLDWQTAWTAVQVQSAEHWPIEVPREIHGLCSGAFPRTTT